MLINQQPATLFNGLFTFCPNILNYQAVSSSTGTIDLSHHTELIAVEKFSLYIGAINCCNKIKHNFSSLLLETSTSTEIKSLLNDKYLFLLKKFLEFPQHIHNQTNI